jgi:hypothetical protein
MALNKQQSFRTRFPSNETQRKDTFKQLNQNKKVADIETLFKLVNEGSVKDGDKGAVIISDSGNTYTLADNSVTNEKIVSVDGLKVSQSKNYRLVTDTEKTYWNEKEQELVAGTNITIDRTNPLAPVISGSGVAWGAITGILIAQTDLQSALNAKQDTLVSGTNIKTVNNVSLLGGGNISLTPFKQNTTSSLTGTTTEALITSILIPANTFQANDWLRWVTTINATNNANSKVLRFYFNTSAALIGATQVAQRGLSNAVTQSVIRNMFFVNSISSQKTLVGTALNVATDEATTGTQATLSINFAVDQYFIISGQLAVGTDTITINGITSNINR